MSLSERSARLAEELRQRILVLDGAMGTMIQSRGLSAGRLVGGAPGTGSPARGLSAEDLGGARYGGCNEHLNLTRPDVIAAIHDAYLEAGADLISTNTFGCAPYVLAEYDLAAGCHDITLAAAPPCREA